MGMNCVDGAAKNRKDWTLGLDQGRLILAIDATFTVYIFGSLLLKFYHCVYLV